MEPQGKDPSCKLEVATSNRLRDQLPTIAERIINSCEDAACYDHVDYEPIPSKQSVIEIIDKLREIIFPGYFTRDLVKYPG